MQATDLSLRAIKCCFAVFGVTLRLLVINISSSSPAINKFRRLLHQRSVSQLDTIQRYSVNNTLQSQQRQHAMKPDIGSESRFLPTPPAFEAPLRGRGVVPIGILPCRLTGKNYNGLATQLWKKWRYVCAFWHIFYSRTWQTHRRTHTDTAWRQRPRLHSIARKN